MNVQPKPPRCPVCGSPVPRAHTRMAYREGRMVQIYCTGLSAHAHAVAQLNGNKELR